MQFNEEQQAHIDQLIADAKKEWTEKELNPIVAERDELVQFKPKTLTDDERAIQQKQEELLKKEMELLMKEPNVSDFAGLITVKDSEELKSQIDKLSKVLDERKLNNSYQPQDHRQTDSYSKAEKSGDVAGMIQAKLSKFFN